MIELTERMIKCVSCPLRSQCNQVVPGMGLPNSPIFIVGDAPGVDEDIMGEPFVGIDGKYLDKILNAAGISRRSIYMTTVVKCKTPHCVPPAQEFIKACKKWLWEELKDVKPKVIVSLGKLPTGLFLKKKNFTLNEVVGKTFSLNYIDAVLMPWYNLDYLLQRGKSWEVSSINFFKQIRGIL